LPASRDPDALLAAGDSALERRELPEAAQAYRMAAEASADERLAEQAARIAFENQQMRETALASERWLELNPTSEQAHRYAGVSALRLHRLDEAEEHFDFLLTSAYISPAAGFLALLPVISGEGTGPDVTELFRRLSARHPEVAEGYHVVATAALRSDNFAMGLKYAEEAVGRAPYWVPAKMTLARAQIASGRDKEGLETARSLAMAENADVATRLEYALLLAGYGQESEARALLQPMATGPTVIPGAIRALGVLDLQSGNLDGANARFDELLSTGASSYEALYYLGNVAEQREDTERAIRYYTRVSTGDRALAAQSRVARIKAKQAGVDAGLAHLDEFERSQPQLGPEIVAARAGLLSANDDEKRALEVLDAGISQYPDSLDLRTSRAFLYERIDKVDASIRELRQLLEERPGDAVVLNALGYTLADRTRSHEEAYRYIGAALEQTPDNVAVLDSMGWVLHKLGRDEEALAFLKRALAEGSDPEIDLHLGEVQWALGQKEAARLTWQDGLKRYPENEQLRERLESARP
jgi:tetratricopeptide (TPR) repeat protein